MSPQAMRKQIRTPMKSPDVKKMKADPVPENKVKTELAAPRTPAKPGGKL